MRLLYWWICALVCGASLLPGQTAAGDSEVVRVGPGITPPRLTYKIEPEYSGEAREERIQGTVILETVINEKGEPTEISVISPLGFGLDEQAIAAVSKWRFQPGRKADRPVKILAEVEVNFRFPEIRFDEKREQQRTEFNRSIQVVNHGPANAQQLERAVKSISDLARQKYPAAMYLTGSWKINGDRLPKDEAGGLELLQKAAEKHYGPALYEVARRRIGGIGLPVDGEKGWEEMRAAAVLGSRQAQFFLGDRYEKGEGVPRELDRSRRYFACARRRAWRRASTGWEGCCSTRRPVASATICRRSRCSNWRASRDWWRRRKRRRARRVS
jgi:TonB family protein